MYIHDLRQNPSSPSGLALWMLRGPQPVKITIKEPIQGYTGFYQLSDATVLRLWNSMLCDWSVEIGSYSSAPNLPPRIDYLGKVMRRPRSDWEKLTCEGESLEENVWNAYLTDGDKDRSFPGSGPFNTAEAAALVLVNEWHRKRNTLPRMDFSHEERDIGNMAMCCPRCGSQDVKESLYQHGQDKLCCSQCANWDLGSATYPEWKRPWQVPRRVLESARRTW